MRETSAPNISYDSAYGDIKLNLRETGCEEVGVDSSGSEYSDIAVMWGRWGSVGLQKKTGLFFISLVTASFPVKPCTRVFLNLLMLLSIPNAVSISLHANCVVLLL